MSDSEFREDSQCLLEPETRKRPEAANGDDVATVNSGSWFARLFIFLTVLAALAALASYASQWKKGLLVRGFVVDGASAISDREIVGRIGDFKGRNLENVDTKELKNRIRAIPYLRDAEISKELNGTIRVTVFERTPMAVTVVNGQIMAIDREGFLLPRKNEMGDRFPKLLVVTGINRLQVAGNGLQQLERRDVELIKEFLEAFSQTDYARLLIGELHLAGSNLSWCVVAQSPARFIVGNDGNYKEKLKKFEIFWQKVVSKKGFDAYDTVDLRFRDRIFTRDPLSQEVPQEVSL